MKTLRIFLALALIIFYSNLAAAAPDSDPWFFQTQIQGEAGTKMVSEITVSAWSTPEDETKIFAHLKSVLAADLKANPKLAISVALITSEAGREPQSAMLDLKKLLTLDSAPVPVPVREVKIPSSEIDPTLKDKLRKWLRSNYRLSFTLGRGVLNGIIQTWSLMVMDQPPEIAVAAGLYVGALSAGVAWNLPRLSEFTDHAKLTEKLLGPKKKGAMGIVHQGSSFLERMTKWFLTEHIFINLIKGAYILLGIDPTDGFISLQTELAIAAVLSTLSQGIYEIGVFRERAMLLEKGVDKDQVEIRNQSFAMVGSVLSVAGAIAATQGLEIGPYLLGTLATLGVANWIRIDRETIARKAKKLYQDCSIFFRARRPKTSSRISPIPVQETGTS